MKPRAVTTYYSPDGRPLGTITSTGPHVNWLSAMLGGRKMEISLYDDTECTWTYERMMTKTAPLVKINHI